MSGRPSERFIIDRRKVVDYLLAPEHRQGRSKARFFTRLGFSRENPDELRDAVLSLARDQAPTRITESAHGTRLTIDGDIRGRRVRTIWIVKPGDPVVRLVTAFPIRRRK